MVSRRALVLVDGGIAEIPFGDTLAGTSGNLPTDGSAGMYLRKASAADYDAVFASLYLTDLAGTGGGVNTALAINVGSAGAFVTFNGALGTPSSGNLANCTFPTLNQNTTGSAATLTTSRNIDGQAFNGSADITVIAPGTHAATSKATPVDADELPLVDSAASNVLKRLTWANLKATLKTYLDTLYPPIPTAWTTYTPTVAATSGTYTSASAAGAYKQVGKIVFLRIKVTITTNGTAAVNMTVTAPSGLTGMSAQNQPFACVENGVTGFVGRAYIGNTTTITVSKYDGTYLGGNGYVIEIGGSYETP
jgi:hypothetical protein